jgi:hypothetical protein
MGQARRAEYSAHHIVFAALSSEKDTKMGSYPKNYPKNYLKNHPKNYRKINRKKTAPWLRAR